MHKIVTLLLLLGMSACGARDRGPHAPAIPAGQSYRGGYRLPVEGAWKVHRTHYGARNDQAYAVDLIKAERLPHNQRQKPLSAFPSWNQPIVADGPGVVAVSVDGVPDNPPGVVNGYHAHGNYVVIDHLNGEISLFAHFVKGSIKVRAGQRVGMGELLGYCGNSGRSTMPHLHWQVMSHFEAHRAKARKIRHITYERNGRQSRSALQKGDVVRPLGD